MIRLAVLGAAALGLTVSSVASAAEVRPSAVSFAQGGSAIGLPAPAKSHVGKHNDLVGPLLILAIIVGVGGLAAIIAVSTDKSSSPS